jgi:hypothetical protein
MAEGEARISLCGNCIGKEWRRGNISKPAAKRVFMY